MNKKEVIAALLKNGGVAVKGVKVKNVNAVGMDTYVRVSLTLDREVDGYRANEDGTYSLGKTNVIFISLYSLTSVLKDNENAAFAVNHILENVKSIGVLLSGATIDIIQEPVKEGTDYVNPWSTKAESVKIEHDSIFNHVIEITLGSLGNTMLGRLADALMGI